MRCALVGEWSVCVLGGWEGGMKTLPKWKCHFHVFKDLRFFFALENNFHFKSFCHFISIGTRHPQRWKWHFSLHIKWNMSFKIKQDVSFCKLLTRRVWILASQIYQWCWKAAWDLILHHCSPLYVLEWLWPGPRHSTAMSWPGVHLRWLLSMVELNESCLQSWEHRALVQNSVGVGSKRKLTLSPFLVHIPAQPLLPSMHPCLSLCSPFTRISLFHLFIGRMLCDTWLWLNVEPARWNALQIGMNKAKSRTEVDLPRFIFLFCVLLSISSAP